AETGLELRRFGGGLLDHAIPRIDLERLERHGGSDWVARVRKAVPERADLPALDQQRLVHALGHQYRGDRRISRGQCLGDRYAVRPEPERLRAEPRAFPAVRNRTTHPWPIWNSPYFIRTPPFSSK